MRLLICDDEVSILEGLKQILDWKSLGFTEVNVTDSSVVALDLIKKENYDIVLIDINMPNITGLEVIEKSIENNFKGEFIILSGFSEFSYAQKAIELNVSSYICKPIDEEELEQSVIKLKNKIKEREKEKKMFSKYENEMMKNFINYYIDNPTAENNIFVENEKYQVLAYDNFYKDKSQEVKDLSEILNLSEIDNYISIKKNGVNFLILIGEEAIVYLNKIKDKYLNSSQKNSIFDKLFIYYGKVVNKFSNIKDSYDDIYKLMDFRFFSNVDQHFFCYDYLDFFSQESKKTVDVKHFTNNFSDCIQKLDPENLDTIFKFLKKDIYEYHLSKLEAIDSLTEIYFNTIQKVISYFSNIDIVQESYRMTMDIMKSKTFLYEILDFMKEKFILIINTLKFKNINFSVYEIVSYIEENCQKNLKLKTIADQFNYNSSYLGKLFTRTTGYSFNTYLENVRIEKSKIFLADKNLKIYEVAEKVGYSNVDYFHKKFKSIVKKSPLEYRKSLEK